MSAPNKPTNFYVNRNGSMAILKWDKVLKDTDQNYIAVDGYYVSSTANPNGAGWVAEGTVITNDNFMDKDVFFIKYTSDNLLFRVCPFIGSVIGECATSIGIVSVGNTPIPAGGLWNIGGWDIDIWS